MNVIFTIHARARMLKRNITEEEVYIALKSPDKTLKEDNKYYCQKDIGRAKIEVVYEKDKYINIITVYYI